MQRSHFTGFELSPVEAAILRQQNDTAGTNRNAGVVIKKTDRE
jgi:hypothetical protein